MTAEFGGNDDFDLKHSTQHFLRCFGNLYAPFFAGSAGHRQHTFPFTHLIDRPRIGLSFVERIRILAGGVEVDRLSKAFIEDIVQETVGGKSLALE
jgi:hypothetical protein